MKGDIYVVPDVEEIRMSHPVLQITQTLSCMVRMTSELETNIVAVERVKEYSETPTEAEWFNEEKKPKADWPTDGAVELRRYSTRYRKGLDLVLKDINLQIKPGEKVSQIVML